VPLFFEFSDETIFADYFLSVSAGFNSSAASGNLQSLSRPAVKKWLVFTFCYIAVGFLRYLHLFDAFPSFDSQSRLRSGEIRSWRISVRKAAGFHESRSRCSPRPFSSVRPPIFAASCQIKVSIHYGSRFFRIALREIEQPLLAKSSRFLSIASPSSFVTLNAPSMAVVLAKYSSCFCDLQFLLRTRRVCAFTVATGCAEEKRRSRFFQTRLGALGSIVASLSFSTTPSSFDVSPRTS